MEEQRSIRPSQTRWFPWVASVIGTAAVVAFFIYYPPANELAREIARIVFTVIFTPFILEAFCIILGILIVVTLNNRRLDKESKDEWVYLHQIDPDAVAENPEPGGSEIPEALKRRIEDAPFISKPNPVGTQERLAEIGGFLDLGMVDEASVALLGAPDDEVGTIPYLIERIRLSKLRGDRDKMESLCAAARAAGASEAEIESATGGKSAD